MFAGLLLDHVDVGCRCWRKLEASPEDSTERVLASSRSHLAHGTVRVCATRLPIECARQESNLRPFAPEANALSPELRAPEVANCSRSRAARPRGEAEPGGEDALLFSAMELRARIVELPLAERFTIARESQDVAEVVEVELRHGGTSGFGEAAPIARYDESAASALAWLESVELGDDPWALEEIGVSAAAGRAGRQGRGRRSAARPPGKADRPAGLAAARPATGRASDLLDGLARRPRRHGAPGGGGRGARLPAPQAQGGRRRRARPRAHPRRPVRHRAPAPDRRQRVLDARRGPRDPAPDRDRVLRAAACPPATRTAPR